MKKKYIYIIYGISALCFVMLFVVLPVDTVVSANASDSAAFPAIIIDPGHGGEDGGTSSDNILEKNINLDISLILADMFRSNGLNVKMTRETDVSIHDDSCKTISEKKRSDLNNRIKLFNSSDENIIISIHQNNFSQSKYCGTQVFYSENNSLSKSLAECIRVSVKSLIQKDNERQTKPADGSIFILKKSTNPSVLVECGFLSNPEELEKLKTSQYKQEIAYCIYLGFMEYYYTNYL